MENLIENLHVIAVGFLVAYSQIYKLSACLKACVSSVWTKLLFLSGSTPALYSARNS